MFVQKRKSNKESMLKDESGAVVVIVAMAMVVLLMFVSLTVDYGMMYLQAAKLQTACDAAAMAAASQLPNVELAKYEAQEIMEANGFDLDTSSELTINDEKTEVEVVKKIDVKTSFAQVMNIQKMVTQKKAKASSVNRKVPFQLDYALFSGSTTESLPVYGSLAVYGGPAHTNNALEEYSNRSSVAFHKEYTYVNDPINCENTTIQTNYSSEKIDVQPMPDYRDSIMDQIPNTSECTYYSSVEAYAAANPSALVGNNLTITGKVYIDYVSNCNYNVTILGDVVIGSVGSEDSGYTFAKGLNIGSGTEQGSLYVMDGDNDLRIDPTFSLNGYCVANQSIEFSSVCQTQGFTNWTQSVIYSEHEDIIFNAGNSVVYGLVYAPEGAFVSKGYSINVNNGGVVAEVIDAKYGSLTVNRVENIAFNMEMDDSGSDSGDNSGKSKLVE